MSMVMVLSCLDEGVKGGEARRGGARDGTEKRERFRILPYNKQGNSRASEQLEQKVSF